MLLGKSALYTVYLLIVLGSIACSDEVEVIEQENRITDQEVLTSLRSVLLAESALLLPDAALDRSQWKDFLNIASSQNICDLVVVDSNHVSVEERNFFFNAQSHVSLSLECLSTGIPSQFMLESQSQGDMVIDNISGLFLQVSSFTAQVNLLDLTLRLAGTSGQSADLLFPRYGEEEHIFVTTRFVLEELNLGVIDQSVKTGRGSAELTFRSEEFTETYNATIAFDGNGQVSISIGDRSYVIDLFE